MSERRCVICGGMPPKKDAFGNDAYAYPKTEEEAHIWQISMQAKGCCVDSIREECCVCVEHIPEFVMRAKKIGSRVAAQERKKWLQRAASSTDGCKCPDDGPPGPNRPCVSVLLLNGSSLPNYCAAGQACVDVGQEEESTPDAKVTKRIKDNDSDTEIMVQESGFQDTGGTFPDIDGTEVTLMRTPMQEEEELLRLKQELEEEEAAQKEDPSARRRRNSCLPCCTDVLLLGRGHHPTDDCPCNCEQCSKPSEDPKEASCRRPECCPESQPEQFTQPPCGCECELQVRRELGNVIRNQGTRIRELEELLCRQNNMRNCLQRKLDELYCEFGRLDEAEADADRARLTCPGSERGGPDCPSMRMAALDPDELRERRRERRRSKHEVILKKSLSESRQLPEEPTEEEPPVPQRERVHWFSERSDQTENEKTTRRPRWVNTNDDETHNTQTPARIAVRFDEDTPVAVPSMTKLSYSNPSYSSTSNSNTNSIYSRTNNSNKSNHSVSNRSVSNRSVSNRSVSYRSRA